MRSVACQSALKVTAALGALVALAACQARDPYVTSAGDISSGSWQIATQKDRVTGATLPAASVVAQASNTFVPNTKKSMMQLTCFDGKPLVRFIFDFKVGSDVNTVLGYRFDDKPGRDNIAGARFLQQSRIVVIEDKRDIAQFVADMRGSNAVYVRIRSITEGRTTAEYKVDGSDAALEAAFADCPLAADPPAASQRRRLS